MKINLIMTLLITLVSSIQLGCSTLIKKDAEKEIIWSAFWMKGVARYSSKNLNLEAKLMSNDKKTTPFTFS